MHDSVDHLQDQVVVLDRVSEVMAEIGTSHHWAILSKKTIKN